MKAFMDQNYLLTTETAQHLYHDYAANLPIIDYHCHLDPREIYEDRHFDNITQIWLGGDHYKWRLMRCFGIDEKYITGDATDREKFQKWAETLSLAIGNPLYSWSHLELKKYFGFDGYLTPENAEEVWNFCNLKLQSPEFSARNLIMRSGVEVVCTTDDPADDLEWHRKIAAETNFSVKVLPSFRPDKALGIEKPDYLSYLKRLRTPATFELLVDKLIERLDYFVNLGCIVTDHGMAYVPFAHAPEEEIEAIYRKRLAGESLTAVEEEQFKTALLVRLGRAYKERDLVMQLHFGVIRDLSKRVYQKLGPDAGIDAIGDAAPITKLAAFLNKLDETFELPKTIVYSLNPNDNTAIETVIGAFQTGEARGKLQHGAAWWFNDHKYGIQAHLESLASEGHLATFIGMLTDSRSFLSYARHEYFRRILCEQIGSWVENGEYPNDERLLQTIVRGICYDNAKRYFRFSEKSCANS
jgi:glucuronate isomerase